MGKWIPVLQKTWRGMLEVDTDAMLNATWVCLSITSYPVGGEENQLLSCYLA